MLFDALIDLVFSLFCFLFSLPLLFIIISNQFIINLLQFPLLSLNFISMLYGSVIWLCPFFCIYAFTHPRKKI